MDAILCTSRKKLKSTKLCETFLFGFRNVLHHIENSKAMAVLKAFIKNLCFIIGLKTLTVSL